MSDSWGSDNPYAPNISHFWYIIEKLYFAGGIVSSVLYGRHEAPHRRVLPVVLSFFVLFIVGIVIVLFFQCMIALFNPIYRRGEGVKWGLVSYTAVMFSLATVSTAMNLDILSISYIDNREYPGGPYKFGLEMLGSKAINVVPNAAAFLSSWLADGLLVITSFGPVFTHPDV